MIVIQHYLLSYYGANLTLFGYVKNHAPQRPKVSYLSYLGHAGLVISTTYAMEM